MSFLSHCYFLCYGSTEQKHVSKNSSILLAGCSFKLFTSFMKFVEEYFNTQRLSQNRCSFSLDGLVTPSIGIPTKCMYSVVHYLSNTHPRTSVHWIDLKLQLIVWKQLHIQPATDNLQDSCKHVSSLSREKKLRFTRITYTSFAVCTIFSLDIFFSRENPFNFVILPLLAQNGSKCETREICLMKWPQQRE